MQAGYANSRCGFFCKNNHFALTGTRRPFPRCAFLLQILPLLLFIAPAGTRSRRSSVVGLRLSPTSTQHRPLKKFPALHSFCCLIIKTPRTHGSFTLKHVASERASRIPVGLPSRFWLLQGCGSPRFHRQHPTNTASNALYHVFLAELCTADIQEADTWHRADIPIHFTFSIHRLAHFWPVI
ncbi:hypothetical protein F5882DRAFT_139041 [Hyaloscypha sp. PMI_1271]|nr:hypothetical protein F5882DRAFT_139041 [Hyaloscypha sp. PMI_1271]